MSKSVAQIFMVMNRMCCVMWPMSYEKTWNNLAVPTVTLILIIPFCGTWNMLLSPRMYLFPSYGGFAVTYIKYVEWASLSMFQTVYILTALFFTLVCTSISLYKLYILPDRVKSAEKSLCLVSVFYSVAFLVVAGSQIVFVVCVSCMLKFLVIFQFLAFDLLTVGSAVIIVLTSSQLSKNLWIVQKLTPKKKSEDAIKIFTSVNNRSITI